MKTHDQFAEDLALYALDELTGSERQELEAHLDTCAACRRELQALRGDLGLLGLSSSGPQPPARSKDRLMRAIAAEPRGRFFAGACACSAAKSVGNLGSGLGSVGSIARRGRIGAQQRPHERSARRTGRSQSGPGDPA